MTKIILSLPDAVADELRERAAREYRPPRDHAHLLLMMALGFIDGDCRPIYHPNDAANTIGGGLTNELASNQVMA